MKLVCTRSVVALAALAATVSARTTIAPSSGSRPSDGSGQSEDIVGTVRPGVPVPEEVEDTEVVAPTKPLEHLKQRKFKNEWHMKPVRVVHARVQSDDPALIEGRFVSSFGNGDLQKGYLSAMDSVNTASVEGALMYVQAEGINVNSRSPEERCTRKNKMRNIVFYEIVIAQTNETIAEFGSKWQNARDTFEYGPMVPMDGGRCTAEGSKGTKEILPKACLQYNGDEGRANLGPFVGGGLKDDDVRAPYPDTYWFSFPNTCPMEPWAKKTDSCRKKTRKGLCDIGVAPDGVQCTYAYDILGWIPIDDVVGITNITNKETGMPYSNFTEWCQASTKNNEFVGDSATGNMTSGLSFWKDPLDKEANGARAQRVIELYNQLVARKFKSKQIPSKTVKSFKPLPTLSALRKENPACYESVPVCNYGKGCRREGYSQICRPCSESSDDCPTKADFEFPKLAKAKAMEDIVDSSTASGSGSAPSDPTDTAIQSPAGPPETSKAAKKNKATQAASAAHANLVSMLSASTAALLFAAAINM